MVVEWRQRSCGSISQEIPHRECTFMTMNYNIGEVETKPLVWRYTYNEETKKYEDDFSRIKTGIDWVSHGNYAIYQPLDAKTIREDSNSKSFPYNYIELES